MMHRRGHTLIELLVAISLSAVVTGMVLELSVRLNDALTRNQGRQDATSTATAAVDLIRSDIEHAGMRGNSASLAQGTARPRGFCNISMETPATPSVGFAIAKPQLVVLRSDRFPATASAEMVPGAGGQAPDGTVDDLDEEVAYFFEKYDNVRNLWRLRRAFRTGEPGSPWQCMVLADALVIPPDGAPFRYDILTRNAAGQATVTRRMVIDHPTDRDLTAEAALVQNELFDVNGDGRRGDEQDWNTLRTGSLIAGVHLRFCAGDGRKIREGRSRIAKYVCDPGGEQGISKGLRYFELGLVAKNVMAWRSYVAGRGGG
ncbi:MAG: hypothetical protein CMH50_14280 [Myxococcales bacterium]|nr:hypothetical protein [Myxococcales bacterium]